MISAHASDWASRSDQRRPLGGHLCADFGMGNVSGTATETLIFQCFFQLATDKIFRYRRNQPHDPRSVNLDTRTRSIRWTLN